MRKLTFILFCTLSMLLTNSYAQVVDTTIAHRFNNYLTNNLQEKIYVHTDKRSYLTGEIIWFKLYTVEAYTNRPINVSNVAYVELLDAGNKVVLQAKISIEKGKGTGQLYLPLSISSGNFVLRTYTNWMKNFDAKYFFHKELTIYNTIKADSTGVMSKSIASPAIQFFPEGGNLVAGLTSRIAFKAVDQTGKPLQFNGAVINDRNDTLLRFGPQQFGLGSFYLKPQENQKYRVYIRPHVGKPFYTQLPAVFARGVVMSVKTQGDSILKISIQNSFEQSQDMRLFVHSGQRVILSKRISAVDVVKGVNIPIGLLGDGITHFTLFDPGLQPICERLFFKKPSSLLEVTVNADRKEFSTRDKINLLIHHTQRGQAIAADFSISVYKADSAELNDDIAANLWLTSELKGKIDYPSWFLKNASSEATDILMLTHGWRRFNWKNVLGKTTWNFAFQPEKQVQIISAKLFTPSQQPYSAKHLAYLSIPGKNYSFYTAPLKNNGDVNFYIQKFYGSKKIILQTDPRVDSLPRIQINSPYSNLFADNQLQPFRSEERVQNLLERSIAMQVHNAFYANQLKRETTASIDTTVFYHHADKSYRLDDYVRFQKMEEVLKEYVFEVLIAKRNKNYHVSTFDSRNQKFMESSPLILLDGLPLFDEGNTLMTIDPKTIKTLNIVSSRYAYGINKFDGILSLLTYNGNLDGISVSKNALVLDYEGLQANRTFYAPMYEDDVSKSSRIPDFRSTLFWSSSNETSNDGNAALSFFSGDLDGNYMVVVQALAPNGGAGTGYTSFKVSKKD